MSARKTQTFKHRVLYFLLPGLVQIGLPFLVLPLTTRILTPTDYGLFALVTGVTSTVGALATLGSGIVIARAFTIEGLAERRSIISTAILAVSALTLVFAGALALAFFAAQDFFPALIELSFLCLLMAILDLMAGNAWAISTNICILDRNARFYAAIVSLRGIATALATLWALFVAQVSGPTALFIGLFAGAIPFVLGAVVVLSPYLSGTIHRTTLREMVQIGTWTGVAGAAETFQRFCERAMLTAVSGLHLAGLFAHAQSYGNMLLMGLRPLLQASMPGLLAEAREDPIVFSRGGLLIHFIAAVTMTVGLVMALVGREAIGLLTNGKFSQAAPYAALIVAATLIRIAGRPQQALLIASGNGRRVSRANGLSSLLGIGLLPVLIDRWQAYGAVVALCVQSAALLMLTDIYARKVRSAPHLDGPAVIGAIAIAVTTGAVEFGQYPFLWRAATALVVILAGLTAGILLGYAGWQSMHDVPAGGNAA